MQFTYYNEPGTQIPHCQYKHGISPATVEAFFQRGGREWPDGTATVRICSMGTETMKIVYKKRGGKILIITAHYYP